MKEFLVFYNQNLVRTWPNTVSLYIIHQSNYSANTMTYVWCPCNLKTKFVRMLQNSEVDKLWKILFTYRNVSYTGKATNFFGLYNTEAA